MTNPNDPKAHRYGDLNPGIDPEGAHDIDLALESAIATLADTGRVDVWIISEKEDGAEHVCGAYATLKGAVDAALAITADAIVNPEGGNLNLTEYFLREDVRWRWKFASEEVRRAICAYGVIVVTPDGSEREFGIAPVTLLP